MPTLFTPECSKTRGYTPTNGDNSIRFNGDVGYGVMSEASYLRLERARQQRAGLHAAHGRGVES